MAKKKPKKKPKRGLGTAVFAKFPGNGKKVKGKVRGKDKKKRKSNGQFAVQTHYWTTPNDINMSVR